MAKGKCPSCGPIQLVNDVCPNCGTKIVKKVEPYKHSRMPPSRGHIPDDGRPDDFIPDEYGLGND